jgi:hypothetical protein
MEMCRPRVGATNPLFSLWRTLPRPTAPASRTKSHRTAEESWMGTCKMKYTETERNLPKRNVTKFTETKQNEMYTKTGRECNLPKRNKAEYVETYIPVSSPIWMTIGHINGCSWRRSCGWFFLSMFMWLSVNTASLFLLFNFNTKRRE